MFGCHESEQRLPLHYLTLTTCRMEDRTPAVLVRGHCCWPAGMYKVKQQPISFAEGVHPGGGNVVLQDLTPLDDLTPLETI